MSSYLLRDKTLKRSLDLNILAGSFGTVYFTVIGNPSASPLFAGFMRMLGAGDLVFSVALALPMVGVAVQILGAYLLEVTGKRKFLFISSGLVSRFFWVPIALIPFVFRGFSSDAVIWSITSLVILSSVTSSIAAVTFNTWMGDLIPSDIRGRYFGSRSLISAAAGTAAALIVGLVIDRVNSMAGFTVIFIIASVVGLSDIACFFFIKHPPMEVQKEKPSLLKIITEPVKNKNYMRFILFVTAFTFATNLVLPVFQCLYDRKPENELPGY